MSDCSHCDTYDHNDNHAPWCSSEGQGGSDLDWPWPYAGPVFFKGTVMWLTCASGQDLPEGWQHTGGTTPSGEAIAEPTSDSARAFVILLGSRYNFEWRDPRQRPEPEQEDFQVKYTEILEDIAPFLRDYYTKGIDHIDTRGKAAELRYLLSFSETLDRKLQLKFGTELDPALMALLGLRPLGSL